MKLTLIVVRGIVVAPKTTVAGVILGASFSVLTRLTATSGENIAPSRFIGCQGLSVMIELRTGRGVAVLCEGRAKVSGCW